MSTQTNSLKVIKRTGSVVPFDREYIRVAVVKAFADEAVFGKHAAESSMVRNVSEDVAAKVEDILQDRVSYHGSNVAIEDIQDLVELTLMRNGEHLCAREYVKFRESKRVLREQAQPQVEVAEGGVVYKTAQGDIPESEVIAVIDGMCEGFEDVSSELIMKDVANNVFDGMEKSDLWDAILMVTRTLIEKEPNYSYVAAQLVLSQVRDSVQSVLGDCNTPYELLKASVEKGVALDRFAPEMLDFDLELLASKLDDSRDRQFKLLGVQNLVDRYLQTTEEGGYFETPQLFFMRVAMGVSLNEENKNESAIEFYSLLSQFDYMASTPTLFNAGTVRSQLSSCYLTTVPDDLDGIYESLKDNAMLSKWAGGLGNDWTNVRGLGSYIKGTNGKSQGVVPFLKVVNDTAVAVNQGGKRKGAVCAFLETWHIDIEEFLELRKNTGDDRRRTHDMNTANWIPDLFMQRVSEKGDWTLFTPSETPDLHDLYGKAFKEKYEAYEAMAAAGEIKLFKTIKAEELWRKILGMVFETGHPWITFKDACNIRSPQQHAGVVHSSNLCTEITLNTSEDEIAVCNLGSINLVRHLNEDGSINKAKLEQTVKTAVRLLDNVIDINYYAVPEARNSNLKHRPVGMGLMGFQDALYIRREPYGSESAVAFADESMELISYYAIEASADLAKERGQYSSFEGSLWSQGVLPIDSIAMLAEERGGYIDQDTNSTLDWDRLREKVKGGMRNSNIMAIAPTATIANIVGVSQSIEPTFQNLYVKSNLSGEFTVVNEYMARDLKKLGLWDEAMTNDLKYFEGSVQEIERMPEDLKALYATSFEVEPRWLIDAASMRQKWIDQAQSLNLYMAEANGKKIDFMYRMAWQRGLKTTYYLRALGATSTEKSTLNTGALNAVSATTNDSDFTQAAPVPSACSIDNPDCEACQ